MKNRRCDITWNDFGNMLIFIALPIAVQNLLTTTASMIDTIMIGSQGELSVAAVGICSQIGSLLFNLYWGFVSGAVKFPTKSENNLKYALQTVKNHPSRLLFSQNILNLSQNKSKVFQAS